MAARSLLSYSRFDVDGELHEKPMTAEDKDSHLFRNKPGMTAYSPLAVCILTAHSLKEGKGHRKKPENGG